VRRHVDLILENHALLTKQNQTLDRHSKDTVKRDATAQRLVRGVISAIAFEAGAADPVTLAVSLDGELRGGRARPGNAAMVAALRGRLGDLDI
jgi:hypothetical protein